jgi:hypothetical protein
MMFHCPTCYKSYHFVGQIQERKLCFKLFSLFDGYFVLIYSQWRKRLHFSYQKPFTTHPLILNPMYSIVNSTNLEFLHYCDQTILNDD